MSQQTAIIITHSFITKTGTYHVTWKYVLHIPASQPMHTPVLEKRSSSHKEQVRAPHLLYGISNSVTLERRSTSPNATPGTYKAQTKCTHFPTSVSLNIPPARYKYLFTNSADQFHQTIKNILSNNNSNMQKDTCKQNHTHNILVYLSIFTYIYPSASLLC